MKNGQEINRISVSLLKYRQEAKAVQDKLQSYILKMDFEFAQFNLDIKLVHKNQIVSMYGLKP